MMTNYDFRADADALRAELAKPLAEDALVEAVAKAIYATEQVTAYEQVASAWRVLYREQARAAIAAVREHDAGMLGKDEGNE